MKLIRPSFEILEQQPGLQGMYDIIERCGKTSYKSESKGGEVARKFVESRMKERHGAVLEFGTVYLHIVDKPWWEEYGEDKCRKAEIINFYESNQYSRCIFIGGKDESEQDDYYITTNYRVLVENNRLDDLDYICEPTEHHKKRYAVKFITDIGVGREFLRHRVMSLVQESTRYVNYSKDKFGKECTFVLPPWIPSTEVAEGENISWWDGDWVDINEMKIVHYGPVDKKNTKVDVWLHSLSWAEDSYLMLLNNGWTPQQARTVLPLATKTEFVLCGFEDAWIHFFRLRSDMATTGKPHPQAEELATPLREEFVNRNYITRECLEKEAFGSFDVGLSDTVLK